MFLIQLIEEVEQLCAIYHATENEEQRQKLRGILSVKYEVLSNLVTKMKNSIASISGILSPQERRHPVQFYTPYDI